LRASNPNELSKNANLTLYSTPPHSCAYFTGQQATTVFVDPFFQDNLAIYSYLSKQGFRRSGQFLYRPHCQRCEQCISVRIPVHAFKAHRNQRRIWKKNQDLTVSPVASYFKQEHFELYQRYLLHRHKNGGMDNPTPRSYVNFLTCNWANIVFYEFRLHGKLLAVAVVDFLGDSLSAVYTFFDPDYSKRSLGVYAILWEIEESKRLNLEWLYLGYWIKNCKKMSYKTNYYPLEYYHKKQWQRKEIDDF